MGPQVNRCERKLISVLESYGPSLIGTDVFIVSLTESQNAIVFLEPNSTIALGIKDVHDRPWNTTNHTQTSTSVTIPFRYFTATSLISNSTSIYIYYQFSETSIGEIIYDTLNRKWGQVPAQIPFF